MALSIEKKKLGVLSYDIKHFPNHNTENCWAVTSLADTTNTTLNIGAIYRIKSLQFEVTHYRITLTPH